MMKKFYLALFLLVSIAISAHDYVPFVQEGKSWIFEHETTTGTEVSYSNYMMKGDTLINGLQYKRLLHSGNYCGAFRESGMKVYYFSPSKDSESLCYDFGLRKDEVIVNPADNQNWRTMSFDSISSGGRNLYKWGLYYDPTINEPLVFTYWIEGVGSLHGPMLSFDPSDGSWTTLRSCQTGDDIIYCNESQPLYTEATKWVDGYYDDENGIVINRHAASGDTLIQGRKYHKMSVVSSKIQNSKCTCTQLTYYLSLEQNGNLWLYTDDEAVFNLYQSDPDGQMGKSLVGKDLFLFNVKSSRQVCIAYGKASKREDGNYIWEKRKTWISGETGVVDFTSSRRSTPETPDLIAGVGWAGYGPLWGLGESTTGKRFYLSYFEGSNLLYEDSEQKAEVEEQYPGVMSILSETYKPILTEGKSWVCATTYHDDTTAVYNISVAGDTIVANRQCKKIKIENLTTKSAPILQVACEENGKMYSVKDETFSLMFDLGVHKGDILDEGGEEVVIDEDYVIVDGEYRKRLTIDSGTDGSGDGWLYYIVEGIGVNHDKWLLDPNQSFKLGGHNEPCSMVSCSENGKIIFTQSDFRKSGDNAEDIPSPVHSIISDPTTSPLHDLQGRQLQHEPARGVFIKDGRKWVK